MHRTGEVIYSGAEAKIIRYFWPNCVFKCNKGHKIPVLFTCT